MLTNSKCSHYGVKREYLSHPKKKESVSFHVMGDLKEKNSSLLNEQITAVILNKNRMNTLISLTLFGTLFSSVAFKSFEPSNDAKTLSDAISNGIYNVSFQEKSTANLFDQSGTASYYANSLHGRRTASGKVYSKDSLVCAHKTLPLGTLLKVTNIKNDSVVYVTVIDRMGKSSPHIIDLSMAGAKQLNFWGKGITKVRVEQYLIPTIVADTIQK